MKSTCNLVGLVQLLLGAASGCSLLASEPACQQELRLELGGRGGVVDAIMCFKRMPWSDWLWPGQHNVASYHECVGGQSPFPFDIGLQSFLG